MSATIRVTATRHAFETLIRPVLCDFCARYPQATLEVLIDTQFRDIIADRLDPGIRPGEKLPAPLHQLPNGGIGPPAGLGVRTGRTDPGNQGCRPLTFNEPGLMTEARSTGSGWPTSWRTRLRRTSLPAGWWVRWPTGRRRLPEPRGEERLMGSQGQSPFAYSSRRQSGPARPRQPTRVQKRTLGSPTVSAGAPSRNGK